MEDLEVILVNDGSPDNSAAIMAEYAAKYPQKVRTITLENGGQGRARNFGIDIAQGDFLSFIDSDDYIAPDMYALMLAAAEENGADVVVCDMEKRFDDGRREYVHAALNPRRWPLPVHPAIRYSAAAPSAIYAFRWAVV